MKNLFLIACLSISTIAVSGYANADDDDWLKALDTIFSTIGPAIQPRPATPSWGPSPSYPAPSTYPPPNNCVRTPMGNPVYAGQTVFENGYKYWRCGNPSCYKLHSQYIGNTGHVAPPHTPVYPPSAYPTPVSPPTPMPLHKPAGTNNNSTIINGRVYWQMIGNPYMWKSADGRVISYNPPSLPQPPSSFSPLWSNGPNNLSGTFDGLGGPAVCGTFDGLSNPTG